MKCHAEVEAYKDRVFVRLTYTDHEQLKPALREPIIAGALVLLPSTWRWLKALLERETELTIYGVDLVDANNFDEQENTSETETQSNRSDHANIQHPSDGRGNLELSEDRSYFGYSKADGQTAQEDFAISSEWPDDSDDALIN